MTSPLAFGLNHMTAPRLSVEGLMDLAVSLGIKAIEIRNDLEGREILTGLSASEIGALARAKGLEIISINALQRFNDWNPAREKEAAALCAFAKACGAKALVLVPVNDANWQLPEAERLQKLRVALRGLMPILAEYGITGLVEPLGFEICSLRSKREAAEAIDDVGGAHVFKLVHDTFHHALAGEPELFPSKTGLVHISGVTDRALKLADMRDAHRVLVDTADVLDNKGQVRALKAAGVSAHYSFEPFSDAVHASQNLKAEIESSMKLLAEAAG